MRPAFQLALIRAFAVSCKVVLRLEEAADILLQFSTLIRASYEYREVLISLERNDGTFIDRPS